MITRGLLVGAILLVGCHRGNTSAPVATKELPPSLHGLTTSPTAMTVRVGEARSLRVNVQPARVRGPYVVRYTTSAPSVATVDSTGAIRGGA